MRLASRTWKRADSPPASELEIHKPQRPFGRLLFTLRPRGFFGPRRICGCKGNEKLRESVNEKIRKPQIYVFLTLQFPHLLITSHFFYELPVSRIEGNHN